jgi:hypothetical protein
VSLSAEPTTAPTRSDARDAISVRHRLVHVCLILATPWLQLALNPSLFVTPGGWYIDPWLYTGLFVSLPDLVARIPDTYYGSRLSWLVPGYLAHRAFPPLAASYVLHLTFLYALLFSIYVAVAAGRRRAEMLVTAIVAWNPVILAALSWDYPDGAGIVFIAATLMCLERSVSHGRFRLVWSLVAGVLMTSMACSNLFLVVTWPLFGLFLLLRLGPSGWHDLIQIGAAVLAGAIAAFLALACLNVAFGGSWFFVGPQVRMSRGLMSAPNPWQLAGYSWLRRATWLVLPAVATAGAIIACVRWSRLACGFARAMQVVMLAAVLVWTVVQLSGTPVFQISHYSSYLAPFALIALSLQSDANVSRLRAKVVMALEIGTVCLFAIAYWLMTSDPATFWADVSVRLTRSVPAAARMSSLYDISVVVGLAGGVMMILAVQWLRTGWLQWMTLAAGFSVMMGAAPENLPSKSDDLAKPYYRDVIAAHRFIARHVHGRKLRIWSSDPRGTKRPIIGTASTYFWGYVLINYNFPRLEQQEATLLSRDTRLVLLVPTIEDAARARAPLQELGYDFAVVASEDFGKGDLAMSVVIGDLR